MYHSALVALQAEARNEAVSEMAIDLAARQHLQLSAIVVIDPAEIATAEPVPLGAGAAKARRDEAMKRRAHEGAKKELDAFARRCDEHSVSCTTTLREGPLESELPLALESADMLVVGHGDDTEACSEVRGNVSRLDKMLRSSARACLVVPCLQGEVQRVVVAYDGSLQAAAALHDFAASGLWQECPVDVVSLAADGQEAAETAERAAGYLRMHDYAVEAHPLVAKSGVADHVLGFVSQSGAGALVMGAYGKPRWHEFVFGTVTRSVLRATMVPVFVSR